MAEQPTAREVVRIILRLNGDVVEGKTVLQKLTYLTCQREPAQLNFEPYFYGPFSRDLENAIELLQMSEDVIGTVTQLGHANTGWPISRTTYRLTESGCKNADEDIADHERYTAAAKEVLENAKAEDPNLGPRPLSVAAKVHYVLSNRGTPLTDSQVASSAQDLGWELSDRDLMIADALLNRLGMIVS